MDPDLQIRGREGGGHPDPEIRGESGLKKNFFGPSGPSPGGEEYIRKKNIYATNNINDIAML